jgi:hypothetical protein
VIRGIIRRAPLTLGWAATAACAFLGAYLSTDASMTGGLWAAGGSLALVGGCLGLYRAKYRASRHRELVAFHEWSTRTLFVVRDKDGRYWQWSVAQLRYAGDLLYDEPAAAAIYNHEWLVKEERPTHG